MDRAVTALEILARRGHAGVGEIADELGVHTSTASRLLAALQDHELVGQCDDRGHYELGFGVLRLANSIPGRLDLLRHARPVMDTLAEELQETITIAVLQQGFVVNVGQSVGRSAITARDWIGELAPPHATSGGKVLLAALPPGERRTMTQQLDRFTDQTITTRKALTAELRAVTHHGYSTAFDEFEVGLRAVAAPIHDRCGATVAALSASGPSYRFGHERTPTVVTALQRATHEINTLLDYAPAAADA